MQIKSIPEMNTQRQARSRLRISDQDALLKWCRSNGFSLEPRNGEGNLAFDINAHRGASGTDSATLHFVLTAGDHDFSVENSAGRPVARGTQLREVLKEVAAHLAGLHSEAS